MNEQVATVLAATFRTLMENPNAVVNKATVSNITADNNPDASSYDLCLLDSGATHWIKFTTKITDKSKMKKVRLQLATGQTYAWMDSDGAVWVESTKCKSDIIPMGKFLRDNAMKFTWENGDAYLQHEDQRIDLHIMDGLPYIKKNDLDIILRDNFKNRFSSFVHAFSARLRDVFELMKHRAGGHQQFSKDCPECRKANPRTRPHFKLDANTRPGGELSIDISGPHGAGYYPKDTFGFSLMRYALVGVFQTFDPEEFKHKLTLESMARKSAGVDDVDLGPEEINNSLNGSSLYYCIPLRSKELIDTEPAIKAMVNSINNLFKARVVYRIHGDKAMELTGPMIKNFVADFGIVCWI